VYMWIINVKFQFGTKIFQLGRAAIRDWRVQAISSSPICRGSTTIGRGDLFVWFQFFS